MNSDEIRDELAACQAMMAKARQSLAEGTGSEARWTSILRTESYNARRYMSMLAKIDPTLANADPEAPLPQPVDLEGDPTPHTNNTVPWAVQTFHEDGRKSLTWEPRDRAWVDAYWARAEVDLAALLDG